MQDNEFSELLNEKIASLVQRKSEVQKNLLNADWHVATVKGAIDNALDQLESLSEEKELDVENELLSLLNQIPRLIHDIWSEEIRRADGIEEEISRWKEMSAYYAQFTENKKKEEESKKKESESRNEVEEADEQMMEAIASGELQEPTRMDQIRRKVGNRPPPRVSRFRKLASKVNNEAETDADDSRG